MSLIHEALKKAEQQRQLGDVPTLGSPVRLVRPRRPWLGLALSLAGVAVLVGAAWWWMSHRPVPPAAQASEQRLATVATPPVAVTNPGLGSQPPAPAAKPVAETATTPAAAPPAPRPKAVPPATAMKQKQAGKVTAAPLAKESTAAPTMPQPSQAPTPAGKLVPAAPPANSGRHQGELPMYWELPYAERKDFPEFRISMHVYATNPADRFVILNGTRQKEGDELSGGLKLVAIDPDGIVLESHDKRFRVPRGGGY
ncbi:MAG TPA: general secretion pathway protein GspB [Rhodanobacteraceae bacterium]|nr:general secretion pathway protein GspB [Rhodanobacteraceae bacterium]